MAQSTRKCWAAFFGLALAIAVLSGCSGAEAVAQLPAAGELAAQSGPTTDAARPVSTPWPTAMPESATPPPTAVATADPSVVDGWTGTVVKLDPMAQFDDYFLRSDGEKFGIDGSAAGLAPEIESVGLQGQ